MREGLRSRIPRPRPAAEAVEDRLGGDNDEAITSDDGVSAEKIYSPGDIDAGQGTRQNCIVPRPRPPAQRSRREEDRIAPWPSLAPLSPVAR